MIMINKLTCERLFTTNQIIPIIILNEVEKAIPLAKALYEGGISTMEVTLRTPNALHVIEKIHHEAPFITVGAGTIITDEQYHMAIKHGAQFIVSPGLNSDLISVSNEYNIPFLPGAITPTEVINASHAGFKYLKFFPAESYNGYNALKSLASVFPQVKFCPTGGINLENATKYLELPNVAAVGCSFIATDNLIATNNYAKITELAKQITALVKLH